MRNAAVPVAFCIVVMAIAPPLFGQQETESQPARDQEPTAAARSAEIMQQLRDLTGKAVRISTSGGGQFQGRLDAVLEDRVEIHTSEGLIEQISAADIVKVLDIEKPGSRVTYFQDAAESRLLVMPTGFPLPKGDFQVTDQEIALVTSSYGVTDWFSVWGGVSVPGAVVNARFSFPVGESVGLSVGSFIGYSWMIWNPSAAALPYVIVSIGKPNQNFTAGISLPVYTCSYAPISLDGVLVALAGKVVVSPSASLVTETWIFVPWNPAERLTFFFPALAFRIAGSRFSWDIGAVLPLELGRSQFANGAFTLDGPMGGTVIPLPLISLTYRI